MQSPQEFMQFYLRQKADASKADFQRSLNLHQRFFAEEYVNYVKNWQAEQEKNPESILSVEISEASAKVITVQPFGNRQQRYRYLLRTSEVGWQIYAKEWECFACKGTGRRDRIACNICGGAGWKDHRTQSGT